MKKVIFLSIGLSILIFSCRKLVQRDVDVDSTDQHCSNYTMDGDELGLDCGGADCATCVQTVLPCTLVANEFEFYNGWSLSNLTFTNQSLDTSTGYWVFSAETNANDYILIRFNNKPDVTKVYAGEYDSFGVSDDEVYIIYYQPSTVDKIGSGSVYINYTSGSYTISSCDYDFHTWGGGSPPLTQTFSVTF